MATSILTHSSLPVAARWIRSLPELGIDLYVVDSPKPGRADWLAVDALGRVRRVTAAELLALAKMQLEALDALRRRQPDAVSGEEAGQAAITRNPFRASPAGV